MFRRWMIQFTTVAVMFSLLACVAKTPRAFGQQRDDYAPARRKMVEESVKGAGVTDQRVLDAMLQTPRHEFVSEALRRQAYVDAALPIGEQQTISSPFIVAYMTESLDPQPDNKVLEIGTGSGYQAAVLSPLVKEVYSIEIVESLGKKAASTLKRLHYENVHVKVGDGFLGWPEHAPFDKIIVTCSPEKVPQPLVEQLREGGRMVVPVGERYQQTLYLFRKVDGKLQREALRPTLFVPMTGRAEESRKVKPDPANPQAVNGNFEEGPGKNGFVPGWYYQRQVKWKASDDAPQGRHFVVIENEQPGRAAHLLQGIAIDGERVKKIELSAWVKQEGVRYGPVRSDFPAVAISLHDKDRATLKVEWIGPFYGTEDWRVEKKILNIPPETKEAILRIGLFGATGKIYFDDVSITSKQ